MHRPRRLSVSAATTILRRLSAARRRVSGIEGEGLFNDATSPTESPSLPSRQPASSSATPRSPSSSPPSWPTSSTRHVIATLDDAGGHQAVRHPSAPRGCEARGTRGQCPAAPEAARRRADRLRVQPGAPTRSCATCRTATTTARAWASATRLRPAPAYRGDPRPRRVEPLVKQRPVHGIRARMCVEATAQA